MAQFLLGSILITNPVDDAFSANDILNVYWDDSAEDFALTLNGSNFTDTDALIGRASITAWSINYKIIQGITSQGINSATAGYSFCEGDDLVWFTIQLDFPEYPYFEKQVTANSPVCDTGGGAVCDIHFVGPPTVVHSIDKSTGGSVTVKALSSNGTVKYGVGSGLRVGMDGQYNFPSYDEMTNTSGAFSGLYPGSWIVYAKDENDCTASIKVTVLFQPSDAEHYRFEWATIPTGSGAGWRARARIYEREYVGDVVELEYGSESPFNLNKPKQGAVNDKFYPIHPTNATIHLISQRDYQFLPLFTQDNKRYRVVYEIHDGSDFQSVWQGFIEPNVYREDFVNAPYVVEIPVADNLKTLEQQPFTDNDGNILFGSIKLIKVIAMVLKKTGLSLQIRSGINIFEENHDTDEDDDPLDQTYIDCACYRLGDEPFSCWQVLESILRPFGARILQENNQWIIEEIDRAVDDYAYRVFSADGDYLSNGTTTNQVVSIKSPTESGRAALIERDQSMEVIPAYGKITLTSKLNYIGSIVSGGFEKEDLLSPEGEIDENGNPIFGAGSVGVFMTEEGFRDWTLRLNGAQGVSFGRVVLNSDYQLAHATKVPKYGLNLKEQSTRSVGAFYFNLNAWSGNVRDAYLESAVKPFQYGPGDEIRFAFEFAAATPPDSGFMVVAIVLKVGDMYLQPGLLWDSTPHIMRYYPSATSGFQNFDLLTPVPDTDVVVDSTIQARIYYFTKDFYDFGIPSTTSNPAEGTDGEADLRAMPTADIEWGYQADVRGHVTITSPDSYIREIVTLVPSKAEDEAFKFIRPNDYNDTTNPKVFMVTSFITETQQPVRVRNRKHFYLDNVVLDSLIKGQPAPEEDVISLEISEYISEDLPVELYNFDVPNITNAKNMYNNYFRLADGAPTAVWARSGVSESLSLQQILLKVLGANHSAPTFRLTGSFINEFSRIGMNNYIKLVKPGSTLSAYNTEFSIDLDGWSQTTFPPEDKVWSWVSDNDGSAEVTLTSSTNSRKLYQAIEHKGGYIEISVSVKAVPTAGNTREDIVWALFYSDGKIIHTEKLRTFESITSDSSYTFQHTAFAPGQVDAIGLMIQNVSGSGSIKYQISKFSPAGKDITEVYQIADYRSEERHNKYFLELMQISKSYISLSGIDTGGANQSGSTTGRAHSSGYSSGFN